MLRDAGARAQLEQEAEKMANDRGCIEQEAADAARVRLQAESSARDAAQARLAAEQEASAAAGDLARTEAELTHALHAATESARRKISFRNGRIKAAHERSRGNDAVTTALASAKSSAAAQDAETTKSTRMARVAVDHDASTRDSPGQPALVEGIAQPETATREAGSHLTGSHDAAFHEAGYQENGPSGDAPNRSGEGMRAPFQDYGFLASVTEIAPPRRARGKALAGGVIAATLAAVSCVFIGWTPYSGTAQARRTEMEPVRPIAPAAADVPQALTPVEALPISPPLATIDVPNLSFRMQHGQYAQDSNSTDTTHTP